MRGTSLRDVAHPATRGNQTTPSGFANNAIGARDQRHRDSLVTPSVCQRSEVARIVHPDAPSSMNMIRKIRWWIYQGWLKLAYPIRVRWLSWRFRWYYLREPIEFKRVGIMILHEDLGRWLFHDAFDRYPEAAPIRYDYH